MEPLDSQACQLQEGGGPGGGGDGGGVFRCASLEGVRGKPESIVYGTVMNE